MNGGIYNDTLRVDDCSAYFLQRYLDIRQYIQYPERAYQNGIEGVVKISYNVEKDGSISNIYCISDIGSGCGQAVVWAFQRMKASNFKWYPAIYKNQPVRVNQTFEFRFSLAVEKARRASAGF
jgi:TonB family protein